MCALAVNLSFLPKQVSMGFREKTETNMFWQMFFFLVIYVWLSMKHMENLEIFV